MGHTINNGLEPANPFRHRVLAEIASDENTLDHDTDIIQLGLGTLPELLAPGQVDVAISEGIPATGQVHSQFRGDEEHGTERNWTRITLVDTMRKRSVVFFECGHEELIDLVLGDLLLVPKFDALVC